MTLLSDGPASDNRAMGSKSASERHEGAEKGFLTTQELMKFAVLGFGGEENGDIGVSVLPQGEEILVRGAGLGGLSLQGIGTANLEMGQRSNQRIQNHATMVEYLLEFPCRFLPPMGGKVGQAP